MDGVDDGGDGEKVRFFDSLGEERRRGITIVGSGISLVYKPSPSALQSNPLPHVIQLIDSPGHLDFSHEVHALSNSSTSPGCVLLIDAVKGIGE